MRLGGCQGWPESSLGTQVIMLVLWHCRSYRGLITQRQSALFEFWKGILTVYPALLFFSIQNHHKMFHAEFFRYECRFQTYITRFQTFNIHPRNPYTRLRIRHASCGIRFQNIWISCVNAHASVYNDTLPIYIWILIFSVSAHAYAYVHINS